MLIVVNRLHVPAAAAPHLEQGFRHGAHMKDVPGCLGFELWRSTEGDEYQVVTRWQSQADYDTWRNSPAFGQAHQGANSGHMPQISSKLIKFEIVVGS